MKLQPQGTGDGDTASAMWLQAKGKTCPRAPPGAGPGRALYILCCQTIKLSLNMSPRFNKLLQSPPGTVFLACVFFMSALCSQAHAETAMLRVACEEDAQDADVFVNGVFKGQCSVDITVPGSALQIRVVKAVDGLNERIFEQSIRLAPNTVKRVNVVLGPKQPNEQGRKFERERARAAEVLRQQAEAGNVTAMLDLARRYEDGQDFPKTPALAHEWVRKAADTGNLDAQYQLARQFENGIGVTKNLDRASAIYLQCANLKNVNCIKAVAAIEQRNSQEAANQEQRCDSQCRQIPAINKCIQDAKNILGDTFTWNIEPRQKCIDAAYENCMRTCNVSKSKGRIGIQMEQVSKEFAESINLGRPYGVIVRAVQPDSPAKKAGMEVGDIIIEFDGKWIKTPSDLAAIISATLIGANRTVTVFRQGKVMEISVTVAQME